MTTSPKEKAKDLMVQFGLHVEIHKWNGKNQDHHDEYSYDEKLSNANAKACALIAVGEIIAIYKKKDGPAGSTYINEGKFFWMQVKEAINQL